MYKKIFKTRVKKLRQEKKLSQNETAKALNISLRAYQYYESNQKNFLPSYDILIALSNLFNVSIDYLLDRTNNPKINK
jgi:transcriptional regulator with XRE-family HTH domain